MNIPIIEDDVLKEGSKELGRIQALKQQIVDARPHLCIERARIVTQYYKDNPHFDIYEQKAGAFRAVLNQMQIYILPNELIVGHQSERHRSAPLFPEYAVSWIMEELDLFETRPQDKFIVTDEVKKEFTEEIYPFWKGRTLSDKILHSIPEKTKLQRFDAGAFSLGIHEEGGIGHVLPDFQKLVRVGLYGIIEECQKHMEALNGYTVEDMKKKVFYESCVTVCTAIIEFAERYRALALEMAQTAEGARKEDLLCIAKVLERAPGRPAKSLHEALQTAWLYQLCLQIFDNGVAQSVGRVDQIFLDYYLNDISAGVPREREQELICAFFAKFAEPVKIYRAADCAIHAGFPMGQNLCVGGVLATGEDATNDLSYRFLEANRHLKLGQPNFTARVHSCSPHAYLKAVVNTIKLGSGMPQLANDDVFIPSLLDIGVSLKEARNYGIIGCIEGATTNAWGRTNGGYFNIAKYVELALTNGKCLISKKQVGPKTGDARQFKSFDDLKTAYQKQLEYGFELLAGLNNRIDMFHEQFGPSPIVSMLIGGCLESGKDVTAGGAKYNWTAPLGVGVADTVNALYGVKKAVFEDGKYSMGQMVDAIMNDFEGNEPMRAYLKKRVPKYGNDIEEIDSLARWAMDVFFDAMEKYTTPRGGPFVASLLPVASYVAFGYLTGALPDGRKSGEPLADGISPANGTDVNGPTAVFHSVTSIDHTRCPNGVIFNQKFSPSVFEGKDAVDKFIGLIRSYIALKGGHAQFNIVSADVLKKAQENPGAYAGLVVRVAGYSAFFGELSREVQDTIIERTEQPF